MAIYLRNGLGEREWGRFLERYGIPPVIITMPDTIDPSQVDAFCARAVDLNNGASGALPSGSTVTYAQEARGVNPFKEFLEHQQQLVVLMATGGMLTSLTGATGIGQGASGAHEETWRTIVRRDAALIATALNRTVTDALLDRAFPGRPHLAAFDFETDPSPTPAEIFDLAAKAVAAGYQVTKEELEERTGYRLEARPQGPLQPLPTQSLPGLAWNRAPQGAAPAEPTRPAPPPTAALQSLAEALQADLTPAADALQALLKDPSPQAAQALIARLPQLLPQDPEMAAILEEELAAAFGDQLRQPEAQTAPTIANSEGECHAKDPANCPYHGTGKYAEGDAKKNETHPAVGKSGNWKTLGLKAGRDIKGDKPIANITVDEAIAKMRTGDTVLNPLGETLTIDEDTYKHINKKGRDQNEVKSRLREYPMMKACIENPHEIWLDEKTGRRKYVQFLEVNGSKVINAVDESKKHVISWHSNVNRLDYYRVGKLLYVRKSAEEK